MLESGIKNHIQRFEHMQQLDLAGLYVEASVFCAVVECGNFTKASTKLGIAQ